jgi:hypothetical protein
LVGPPDGLHEGRGRSSAALTIPQRARSVFHPPIEVKQHAPRLFDPFWHHCNRRAGILFTLSLEGPAFLTFAGDERIPGVADFDTIRNDLGVLFSEGYGDF